MSLTFSRSSYANILVSQQFVDSEDVGRVHYGAVTVPAAAGKRYLATSLKEGRINYDEVARLAVKAVPELASRFASTAGAPFSEAFLYDGSDAEKDFGFTCELVLLSMVAMERAGN